MCSQSSSLFDHVSLLVLQCDDTLETHLENNGSGRIYHSSIKTSASSSSPCLLPLINQQTSPRGFTLRLSSPYSVCLSVRGRTVQGHCLCLYLHMIARMGDFYVFK